MNTKGIKFLAVLAVMAVAFAGVVVLLTESHDTDAVEPPTEKTYYSPGSEVLDVIGIDSSDDVVINHAGKYVIKGNVTVTSWDDDESYTLYVPVNYTLTFKNGYDIDLTIIAVGELPNDNHLVASNGITLQAVRANAAHNDESKTATFQTYSDTRVKIGGLWTIAGSGIIPDDKELELISGTSFQLCVHDGTVVKTTGVLQNDGRIINNSGNSSTPWPSYSLTLALGASIKPSSTEDGIDRTITGSAQPLVLVKHGKLQNQKIVATDESYTARGEQCVLTPVQTGDVEISGCDFTIVKDGYGYRLVTSEFNTVITGNTFTSGNKAVKQIFNLEVTDAFKAAEGKTVTFTDNSLVNVGEIDNSQGRGLLVLANTLGTTIGDTNSNAKVKIDGKINNITARIGGWILVGELIVDTLAVHNSIAFTIQGEVNIDNALLNSGSINVTGTITNNGTIVLTHSGGNSISMSGESKITSSTSTGRITVHSTAAEGTGASDDIIAITGGTIENQEIDVIVSKHPVISTGSSPQTASVTIQNNTINLKGSSTNVTEFGISVREFNTGGSDLTFAISNNRFTSVSWISYAVAIGDGDSDDLSGGKQKVSILGNNFAGINSYEWSVHPTKVDKAPVRIDCLGAKIGTSLDMTGVNVAVGSTVVGLAITAGADNTGALKNKTNTIVDNISVGYLGIRKIGNEDNENGGLEVADGATLTITGKANIVGTLVNNGTITNNGIMKILGTVNMNDGNGTFVNEDRSEISADVSSFKLSGNGKQVTLKQGAVWYNKTGDTKIIGTASDDNAIFQWAGTGSELTFELYSGHLLTTLNGSITLVDAFVVESGNVLSMANGAVLTVEGTLNITSDGAISLSEDETVNVIVSKGGIVVDNSTSPVSIDKVSVEGLITGSDPDQVAKWVASEEAITSDTKTVQDDAGGGIPDANKTNEQAIITQTEVTVNTTLTVQTTPDSTSPTKKAQVEFPAGAVIPANTVITVIAVEDQTSTDDKFEVKFEGVTIEDGTTVKVTVPYSVPSTASVKVYYVDGTNRIPMTTTTDGSSVTFETTHNSEYAVVLTYTATFLYNEDQVAVAVIDKVDNSTTVLIRPVAGYVVSSVAGADAHTKVRYLGDYLYSVTISGDDTITIETAANPDKDVSVSVRGTGTSGFIVTVKSDDGQYLNGTARLYYTYSTTAMVNSKSVTVFVTQEAEVGTVAEKVQYTGVIASTQSTVVSAFAVFEYSITVDDTYTVYETSPVIIVPRVTAS